MFSPLDALNAAKQFGQFVQQSKTAEGFTSLQNIFNPTSKIQNQSVPKRPFSLGIKIGSFSFGLSRGGGYNQSGEMVDYNAFLMQAGNLLKLNRFMCTVFFPTGLKNFEQGSSGLKANTYACESVTVPTATIETTPYRLNMLPPILAPYMKNYGSVVELVFRARVPDSGRGIEPRDKFINWQDNIISFEGKNAGANYMDSYSSDTMITVSNLDSGSNVIKNTTFMNVYPVEIGGPTLAWEDSGSYMRQGVTMAFSKILKQEIPAFTNIPVYNNYGNMTYERSQI